MLYYGKSSDIALASQWCDNHDVPHRIVSSSKFWGHHKKKFIMVEKQMDADALMSVFADRLEPCEPNILEPED